MMSPNNTSKKRNTAQSKDHWLVPKDYFLCYSRNVDCLLGSREPVRKIHILLVRSFPSFSNLQIIVSSSDFFIPFGQMSFWGATVITNLLSPFTSLIEWLCGGYYVYNQTLKRFFLFHFIMPFLLCGFLILHLFWPG